MKSMQETEVCRVKTCKAELICKYEFIITVDINVSWVFAQVIKSILMQLTTNLSLEQRKNNTLQ